MAAAEEVVVVDTVRAAIINFATVISKLNLARMKIHILKSLRLIWLIVAVFALLARPEILRAADEQTFDSPDQAVTALVTAAKNDDTNAIHLIFGPERADLISPDVVQADQAFRLFVQRLTEKTKIVNTSDSHATLELGLTGWPFPIPLVKQSDGKWFFDTDAGREEILCRRIGMDELGAMDVCEGFWDAQREYASRDRVGDGVFAYAQFLWSTPGTHDGLYWPTAPGEELSPLGPLIAQAHAAGYHHTAKMLNNQEAPYHGYFFKIMTRQGKHAPGGKYDYIINGHMVAGFALVAWPAKWGNTGVMTFIVNQQGKVYQKNLGPDTVKIAAGMKTYDPNDTWTLARDLAK
jgi:hypothetical protein